MLRVVADREVVGEAGDLQQPEHRVTGVAERQLTAVVLDAAVQRQDRAQSIRVEEARAG